MQLTAKRGAGFRELNDVQWMAGPAGVAESQMTPLVRRFNFGGRSSSDQLRLNLEAMLDPPQQ